MKTKDKKVFKEWQHRTRLHFNGTHFVIDYDEQIPRVIMPLDRLVADIGKTKKALFQAKETRRGRKLHAVNELARRVLQCVDKLETGVVRQYLTRHRFSPFFELWESYERDLQETVWLARQYGDVEPLNRCIEAIRTKARESSFRKLVNNQERGARKNWASLCGYFNKVFRKTSRVMVVRLDIGYRNDPSEVGFNWKAPDDAVVKGHLKRLNRFIRRHVPHRLGHVWKIEWGAFKGPHMHLVCLCDGHFAQKGFPIAKLIGEKWEEITGNGSYWNCNASEAMFKRRGQLGIGMIDYTDTEARANLMDVAAYIAKADYYARFISPEIGRTFGKSFVKDLEPATRRGRPRKYDEPEAGSEAA